MEKFIVKTPDGLGLELYCMGEYAHSGSKAFALRVADVPEDMEEEYFPGEPWCDVSVCLPGLRKNEIALDNDFVSFTDRVTVSTIISYLTDSLAEVRHIDSGFVSFPVFSLKEEFLKESAA